MTKHITSLAMLALLIALPSFGMENPASRHCIDKGGRSVVKNTPRGQYGMCILPSGKRCEEWAFYRGTCQ